MPESVPTAKQALEPDVVREAERLHPEAMADFEKTEGWAMLSDTQKAFMLHALFFRPPSGEVMHDPDAGDWYCHAAVWAVEHEHSPEAVRPELDHIEDSFYDGQYAIPEGLDDVRRQIREAGFPAVVHIAKAPPPLTLLQQHTFLALGEREDGEIIGWEKESEELPFRRVTLSENYAKYTEAGKPLYWGVRRMLLSKDHSDDRHHPDTRRV